MSDAAARRLAQLSFRAPLLLEAGAGTGKTAVLVARVVAWSLGEGWALHASAGSADAVARKVLSRVVAITFTEAAAAEMATRIAAALRDVALGKTPTGVFEDALPTSREHRVARASALRGALDHLTVRTIHAFCRRLLASHPLEAELHPQLTVDPDQQLTSLVAREVLEERLLAAFGAGGEARTYAELAEARIGPADLERALVELLAEGASARDLEPAAISDDAYAALGGALEAALGALLEAAAGQLARGKANDLGTRVHDVATQLREWLAEQAPLRASRLAAFDCEALFPKNLRARLGEWADRDFNSSEKKLLSESAREAVTVAARALHPLVSHLAKLKPRPLAAAREVLADLLGEARKRLREQGVATYGALLRDARDLLADEGVAREVRASFDQLLVDEFQDTDETQCELMAALGFGPGPHPTLFVVGDPKQSIYGWRNADLRAYDEFKARVIAEGGGHAGLNVSYRSVLPILAEVERAIAPVMHEATGLQPCFQQLEVCEARRGQSGFSEGGRAAVEHWLGFALGPDGQRLDEDSAALCEREARAAADDLVRLHRDHGVRFGEVAILLRATTELQVVLGALREAGVPFVVERETSFYQRREVVDALAWIRCVLDPHDQIALITALRSASVGIPDAALVPLLKECSFGLIARLGLDESALPAAREKLRVAATAAPRGVPGFEALAGWPAAAERFFVDLAASREAFATLPADRFVEALRTRSLLEATEAARHLGAHRIATLDRIFRDLAEWSDVLHGSPSQLLAALRRSGGPAREHQEGRPTTLSDDAVQVLTIHRAKGLDFEHVYLLQLHRLDGGGPDVKPTHLWRRGRAREYQLLGLVTPGAWRPMAEATQREALERVRLLYVAMTRAKDRLVLSWSPPAAPAADGCAGAKKLGDLFTSRRGAWPALDGVASAPTPDAAPAVLWRQTPFVDTSERARLQPAAAEPKASEPDVAADEAALRAARREAERREARPVQRVASELTHDDEAGAARSLPDEDAPEPLRAFPDRERRIAMAAGTAVHAALEHVDFADDAETLAERGARAIASALALCEPADERTAAEQRARAIWERVCAGPLLARLRALAPRILARELPVLLAPSELPASDDAPVGFVSGAIDLLYEDESGEIVVADYKTDAVSGEAELREKTAHYAGQGAVYVTAVQRALGLEAKPKFELWFLQAGMYVTG